MNPGLCKDITGIILSGGESRRMMSNKSLLKLGPKTVVELTRDLIASVFENVLLSTNDFESYRFLGLEMFPDLINSCGPLSGIYSALKYSTTDKNFIFSCDMPLMSEEMIRYIAGFNSEKLIVIPSADKKIQHLCGIYHKKLIPVIEEMFTEQRIRMENGKSSASIKKLIERTRTEILETDSLPFYNEDLFFNMNSRDDYEYVMTRVPE